MSWDPKICSDQLYRKIVDLPPSDEGQPMRYQLNLKIDALACKIFNSIPTEAARRPLLDRLVSAKRALTLNCARDATGKVSSFKTHFNLKQPIPPTPLCPAYDKIQVPTISNYHNIPEPYAAIRLDPELCWDEIPESIRACIGRCPIETIDLFFTVLPVQFLDPQSLSYEHGVGNVCFHHWTYPHMYPGMDRSEDTLMGLFPVFGISQASDAGAIAIGRLSPMQVHAHPPGFGSDEMLLQIGHPLCGIIRRAERENIAHPQTMIDELRQEHARIMPEVERLNQIAERFGEDPASSLEAVRALPEWMQKGIFYEVWLLKRTPRNIHHDFGKVSFFNEDIAEQHFCTLAQRQQAIRSFIISFRNISDQFPLRLKSIHSPKTMKYSPNNAHFQTDPLAPLFVTWAVAQKDGRTCITKMVGIVNSARPINKALKQSVSNCNTFEKFVEQIDTVLYPAVQEEMSYLLNNARTIFESNPQELQSLVLSLPKWMESMIYQEVWKLKGSPMGIHPDFGGASFRRESIDPVHFCSDEERLLAIQNFASLYIDILVGQQKRLFQMQLHPSPNILELEHLAEQMVINPPSAIEQFNHLPSDVQRGVFGAVWELHMCPLDKGEDFGLKQFYENTPKERADAILLYASRCRPNRDLPYRELVTVEIEATEAAAAGGRRPSFSNLHTCINECLADINPASHQEKLRATVETLDEETKKLFLQYLYEDMQSINPAQTPDFSSEEAKLEWMKDNLTKAPTLSINLELASGYYVRNKLTDAQKKDLGSNIWLLRKNDPARPDLETLQKVDPDTSINKRWFDDFPTLYEALDRL